VTAARYAEVIGDPIEHSRSPQIHRFWLDAAGLPGDYRATRVTRAELPGFIESRRADPLWLGCNVTMPLKLDALLLAGESTDRATAAGAANLLVRRDGELVAANTDVGAVMRLVGPLFDSGVPPRTTVLGAGGAARAVLVALRLLGVGDVRLQARDISGARALAVEFGLPEPPSPFDRPIDSGGLVNATPLGMTGHPPFALDMSAMPTGGWVFDLVSDPCPTPLVEQARARGLKVIDGLDMLVEQAAAAFELLFGEKPDRARDDALFAMLRKC
jgi:shikimate dehydrogenase